MGGKVHAASSLPCNEFQSDGTAPAGKVSSYITPDMISGRVIMAIASRVLG
jgi:hypothetical protein